MSHHDFGCILIPNESREGWQRWMKTTSGGYTSSVKANTTHGSRKRARLETKLNIWIIRFAQLLTSYQGKSSLNSVNLLRTMNVARASATCKKAYYSSEETKSVKHYSWN